MRLFVAGVSLLVSTLAGAAEGMWTLDNLPVQQLQANYAFTPGQDWINKVMHSSVRLAQGCSGSFISPAGLVMTNHHCSVRCIADLSSASKDYIRDGFLAASRAQELRCPLLELNRLEQITDVTATIKAATNALRGDAFMQALNAAKARLTSTCIGAARTTVRCDVVDLYQGGMYHLYRYHRFQDVRLVWAPEQAAAFFGGDPDNFNFPRYDLDVTFLRAYENGKPARIKDYFRFKATGAEPGELTFVTGHPGATQRGLTVAQLTTLRDVRYQRDLLLYAELRGVLQQYQKLGSEPQRIAAGDLFSIENTLKARRGALATLQDAEFVRSKQQAEAALQQYVETDPELAAARTAWQDIAAAEAVYRLIGNEYYFIESGRGFLSSYFNFARMLVRGAAERAKPDGERLPEFAEAELPALEQSLFSDAPLYPEYEQLKLSWSLAKLREWLGADHPLVRKVLGKESPEQLAARLIGATQLGDVALRKTLWADDGAVAQSNDPFIQLAAMIEPEARALRKRYDNEIESVRERVGQLLAEVRFKQSGKQLPPDATFTLRLSYGEVRGWRDGERDIEPFTDIDGAFARHTGAEPFALPGSWLAARDRLDGSRRLNFVTTHDIIGGNSGSPVINRNAEIVGLIFDGNIHSLGGGFWYDARLNRAVAVHPAAILEALRVIYPAPTLLQELTAR
ncbi:MAG: S46 family peptidase [Steroidobacteraceae bacterium]